MEQSLQQLIQNPSSDIEQPKSQVNSTSNFVPQYRQSILPKYVLQGLPKKLSAEFFGTMILVIFGTGVNAQLSMDLVDKSYLSGNIAWGIGVMMGIYISLNISGGHLNPAVTFAMAIYKKFPWRDVAPYWLAQICGAYIGSLIVYVDYYEELKNHNLLGNLQGASIFASFRDDDTTNWNGFYDQVFSTGLLLIVIFSLVDQNGCPVSKERFPMLVGIAILGLGAAFGLNCGYPLNPARDFGPRLMALSVGYGTQVFTNQHYWFWIPIIGPIVGGVFGSSFYQLFIGIHHEKLYVQQQEN